jgi:hypothetical protein
MSCIDSGFDGIPSLNTGGSQGITTKVLAIAIVATFLGVVLLISSLLLIARKYCWWPFSNTSTQPSQEETQPGTSYCQKCSGGEMSELDQTEHKGAVHEISGDGIMPDYPVR